MVEGMWGGRECQLKSNFSNPPCVGRSNTCSQMSSVCNNSDAHQGSFTLLLCTDLTAAVVLIYFRELAKF